MKTRLFEIIFLSLFLASSATLLMLIVVMLYEIKVSYEFVGALFVLLFFMIIKRIARIYNG